MIEVKIFGTIPPCAKCKMAQALALEAAEKFPGQVKVEKLNAMGEEGANYGIEATPTIIINNKIAAVGKLLTVEEFEQKYQRILGL